MPFRGQMPFDFRSLFIKSAFLIGILIIIYAILWILAVLNIIPMIVYALFPQVVLLCIGVFIVYVAYTKKKEYY